MSIFKVRYITLLVVLLGISFQSLAQKDTLFWFVAPDTDGGYPGYDTPVVFRIVNFSKDAIVTISQPANPSFPTKVLSVPAGRMATVDLTPWIDKVENQPANQILNYGIKISSTNPITVYYEINTTLNPEIFVLKGQNALGTEFFIPSQNVYDNLRGDTDNPSSSFEIVATEDNTTVNITPRKPIVGRAAGVQFSITLNKGQTYSATARGKDAKNHLQGSKVSANKPIAITIKDDAVRYDNCADLGGDQIVPISKIGTEYIAINGLLNYPDDLFVLATQDNTKVYQDGSLVGTLKAGATLTLQAANVLTGAVDSSTYIKATSPVYVLQASGFGCEIGIDILPSIVCTGSSEVGFVRSLHSQNMPLSLFVNILVQKGGETGFLVNGKPNVISAARLKPVPGTNGEWLAGKIELSDIDFPILTPIRINNTSFLPFHASVIHGTANIGTEFGYFSDFSAFKANAQVLPNNDICVGDTIFLSSDQIRNGTTQWTGPNNFTSGLANPFIANASEQNSGIYKVITSNKNCVGIPDSLEVTVHAPDASTIEDTICKGGVYRLPSGKTTTISGTYIDTLANRFGCDSVVTSELFVRSCFHQVSYDTICEGAVFTLPDNKVVSASGVYTIIFKDVLGADSIYTNHLLVLPKVGSTLYDTICEGQSLTLSTGRVINTPGTYLDTFTTKFGCDSRLTREVSQFPEIKLNISAYDACKDQQNGIIEVSAYNATGPFVYQLENNPPDVTGKYKNLSPKEYTLSVQDRAGCSVTQSIKINRIDKIDITIDTRDSIVSSGKATYLQAKASIHSARFLWTPNQFLSCDTCAKTLANPSQDQRYFLTVKVGNNGDLCTGDTSIIVKSVSLDELQIPTAFSPNGDGVNDELYVFGMHPHHFSHFELQIFDRYGNVVFATTDPAFRWHGKWGNKALPVDVYFIAVSYASKSGVRKTITSDITLIK